MSRVLWAAAVYNMVWGAAIVLFPLALFRWAHMPPPNYPMIWQCVGMVVGVYGVGYACAARDPYRHWPIVLVGFLGKLMGPIGFLWNAIQGNLPWVFGLINVTNDLLWLVPFAIMLRGAYEHEERT
jgi:hypothetical protein